MDIFQEDSITLDNNILSRTVYILGWNNNDVMAIFIGQHEKLFFKLSNKSTRLELKIKSFGIIIRVDRKSSY